MKKRSETGLNGQRKPGAAGDGWMNKKKLSWILILTLAGALTVLGILGASRALSIRSATPVVIEEAVVDIVDIQAELVTPAPTATPALPRDAVTLLVDRKPVLTLASQPETHRLLWEYLKESAVAPEGETFVSARFAAELLITAPVAGAQVMTFDEARALLANAPGLVPVEVTALRAETTQSPVETILSTDEALDIGCRIITQLGAGKISKTVARATYIAGVQAQLDELATQVVREARATIVKEGAYDARDQSGEPGKAEGVKGKSKGDLKLAYPMRGGVVSHFGFREGAMHNGIDIENKAGVAVTAPGEGVVRYCGERGAYGFVVDIDHGNGFVSRLTHLADVKVAYNQRVFAGDEIGALADNSTEERKPHLHYELLVDNVPYNPEFYVD